MYLHILQVFLILRVEVEQAKLALWRSGSVRNLTHHTAVRARYQVNDFLALFLGMVFAVEGAEGRVQSRLPDIAHKTNMSARGLCPESCNSGLIGRDPFLTASPCGQYDSLRLPP